MSRRAPRCTCDVNEDPTCPVCNPPAVAPEKTRPQEVIASYVLGGWSRQARTDSELLSAIRAGCEVSPIAEVTIRPYCSPEERQRLKADHDALDGTVGSTTPEQRLISIKQSVCELEQAAKVKVPATQEDHGRLTRRLDAERRADPWDMYH